MTVLIPNKAYIRIENILSKRVVNPKINRDRLYYILSILYYRTLTWDENDLDGGISLSSSVLKDVVGYTYNVNIDFLLKEKIIFLTNRFVKKNNANKYKICDSLNSDLHWHTITEKRIRKKIKSHSFRNQKKVDRHYRYITKWLGDLKIDESLSEEFANSDFEMKRTNPNLRDIKDGKPKDPLRQYNNLIHVIRNFNHKNFYSIDKSGFRLYTKLTSASKKLRKFITYKGEKLVSIDIKNSQPFFLLSLFNEEFIKSDIFYTKSRGIGKYSKYLFSYILPKLAETQYSKGFQRYKNDVINGQLYWVIANKLGHSMHTFQVCKEEIKKAVLVCFFSDIKTYSRGVKTAFSKLYPQVYKGLNMIKKKDYFLTSLLLQRIETFFVLDVMCRKISQLYPDLPIFTIHDSIVTTVGNETKVKEVMTDQFVDHLGFTPSLKIEYW